MVYKVAVVDDEQEIIDNLTGLLDEYSKQKEVEFEITTYNSSARFLENEHMEYDVVFLDINMPEFNGLEVARRMRRDNCTSSIIFCTNYAQYAVKGYEVEAIGYLIKPISKPLFYRNLDRAISVSGIKQPKKLLLKTADGQETVLVSEIIYVEVDIHNILYHVFRNDKMEVIRTRGSMRAVSDKLGALYFSKSAACYLINLFHVVSVINGNVNCHGGVTLPISRKFSKEFNEDFIAYLTKFGVLNV